MTERYELPILLQRKSGTLMQPGALKKKKY